MKNLILSLFLFFLSINLLIAQDQIEPFFKGAKINYEKQLGFSPDEAVAFKDHTFLIQHRNGAIMPILVNVDNAGNEIFKKEFDTFIGDCSTTENGNIITVSVPQSYNEQNCYYCIDYYTHIYDKQGTLISKIKTSTDHTKISKDGNYLITTRIGGGEHEGTFEVFDVNTEKKISLPFKKRYSHFNADFINSTKVALLTEHVFHTRDETQPRKSREAFKLDKIVDSLTIFDVSTNIIEVNKEIRYSKTNFFSTNIDKKSIWVSPDGDKIFVNGYIKSPKEKSSLQRHALLALDTRGETIWEKSFEIENNEFESVKNIEFLDNNTALIVKYGIINSELKMIDNQNGKEKWNQKLGPKFSGEIKGFMVSDDTATLTVDFKSYQKQYNLLMKFDLQKGELLNQEKGSNILTKSRKYSVIKNERNLIRSIQNDEVAK